MTMNIQHTTECFFKELRAILDAYEEGEILSFSVGEEFRKLELNYPDFQVIVGLNKIGFNTFTVEEQVCMLLMVENVYMNGITPFVLDDYYRCDDYKKICEGKNSLIDRGIVD
jgi:hypothetical protein